MPQEELKKVYRRYRWSIHAAKQAADGGHDDCSSMIRGCLALYSYQ